MSFLCNGVDLAKSNRSLWTDQTFILYSMSLFGVHDIVKELLIGMNNKIGSYNLYVVNVHFHLNVFSTQVRVFSSGPCIMNNIPILFVKIPECLNTEREWLPYK
jgi:hypothetical protein